MRTFLFSLILSTSLIAQSGNNSYPISQVTVYKSGAEVERLAQLSLEAGENNLSFTGLSAQLDPKSVQIKGLNSLDLISISHSTLSNDSLKNHPTLQAIEALIDENLEQQQVLIDEKEGLLLERKYLESNSSLGGTSGYTLSQLREISQFVKQERSANAKAISKLDQARKKLQNDHVQLKSQLSQKFADLQSLNHSIQIKLISPKAQKVSLSIHYQVSQAGWTSHYDLKVAALDKPISLVHKAIIYQSSGEDWKNVSLELNTGSMQANGQIPSLYPEYLYPAQRENMGRPLSDAEPVRESRAMTSNFEASKKDMIGTANNSINSNLLSRSYILSEKVSIANGKRETNLLRNLEIPAKFEYQAVPKIDLSAYLIAKVYDWSDYNLEAGELSLYNTGNFVGKSFLNPNISQDTLEISLGKDADIIVKRETLKEEGGSSFLGSRKTSKYAYELSVYNKKKSPIKMVLSDQIPVARHEDIKVEMLIGKLKVSDLAEGKVQWRFSVPSQEKVTKKHQYQISYPKDIKLNL